MAGDMEVISGEGSLTRVRSAPRTVQISDCGDSDPATFIRRFTRAGTDTFTGIIEGTGDSDNKGLVNTCVPALQSGEFRTLVSFTDVAVAGRRGGAILEVIGHFQVRTAEVDGSQVAVTSEVGEVRFLCGTGPLRGIRGTGVYDATSIPSIPGRDSRAYVITIHFDDASDATRLYENMCRDL
jgi:hypothetical protein